MKTSGPSVGGIVFLIASVCSPALGQPADIILHTLALTESSGQYGPSLGEDTHFTHLSIPKLNSLGQVVFSAGLGGSHVTSDDDQGIWIASVDVIQPVARVGTDGPLGPAAGPGVYFLRNNLFSPDLNDAGEVSFAAAINQSPQYNGIWKTSETVLQPLAMVRTDGPLGPHLGPSVEFLPLMTGGTLTNPGQIVFSGIVNQNDPQLGGQSGIWQTNASGPQPIARVRTAGELGPGLDNEYFTFFERIVGGDDASTFIDARLGDGTTSYLGDGLFQITPQRALLSRTGRDDALGAQLGPDLAFSRYDSINVSDGDQLVATARVGGLGVNTTNDHGVWLISDAEITPIARSGTDGLLGPHLGHSRVFATNQATPVQIISPFLGVAARRDEVAFVATVAGGPGTPDDAMGIWIGNPAGLTPIALTHNTVPWGPQKGDDFVFHRFGSLAMNLDGSLFFYADSGPADGTTLRSGIWAYQGGEITPLLSVGDQIHINSESGTLEKTVSSIAWNAAEGVDRSDGRLAITLTFDSGESGAFLLEAFAASLPGDFNSDGRVDAADYIVWRKTDGTPEGYNTWLANFGRTASGGSVSNATVPEPAAALLFVPGAAVGCCRRTPERFKRSKTQLA